MAETLTVQTLLANIQTGWDELQGYLASLSAAQLTEKTDAAGWTVKDHVYHLALWEYGMKAVLSGESRLAAMGIPDTTWDMHYDAMNAVMQQRFQALSWVTVQADFARMHAETVAAIARLNDADLQRPYNSFQPESDADRPVIGWLLADTYEHYAEHLPWIRAIAEG